MGENKLFINFNIEKLHWKKCELNVINLFETLEHYNIKKIISFIQSLVLIAISKCLVAKLKKKTLNKNPVSFICCYNKFLINVLCNINRECMFHIIRLFFPRILFYFSFRKNEQNWNLPSITFSPISLTYLIHNNFLFLFFIFLKKKDVNLNCS